MPVQQQNTRNRWKYVRLTVPALANAGPDCDPCGGPLKVIAQSKTRTNVVVY
jgi:hypothetical protein